jgi:hypothetical protein
MPPQKMMFASKASNEDTSGEKDACVHNFVCVARDVQNWVLCCVGTATTEEQCYCEFFSMRTATRTMTMAMAVATVMVGQRG